MYSGKTANEISETIDKDISTVYREIERNRTHGYHAKEAQILIKAEGKILPKRVFMIAQRKQMI